MSLVKLRQKAGLTQMQVAKRLGVSRSLISLVELKLVYVYPSLRSKLASLYRVSEENLLGASDE